jgi:predicted RNA binding protein YcfA (HicA-like mRNA interferase family)
LLRRKYTTEIGVNHGGVMPVKVRRLKAILSKAGFYSRSAKGSHTKWVHPQFPKVYVILSGKDGNDAKQYQIEDVQDALRKVGEEYEP